MKLALIGATGMVGRVMLQVLQERNIAVDSLIPVGSSRSAGKHIPFRGDRIKIRNIEEALTEKPDVVLFSAGSDLSLKYAERFTKEGAYVIDNSSAWRMEKGIPLIIPEINRDTLKAEHRLIANPNCSTIQLLMVAAPLHRAFKIERMVVSTYQSVTGSGKSAVDQLDRERKGQAGEKAYPHPIDLNCIPHCDDFTDNGYTKEEMKLVNESRKILDVPELPVTATAVRVPVKGGHSESVNITFRKTFEMDHVRTILEKSPGVSVRDDPDTNRYPMPIDSESKDPVFVGRIREDESHERSLNLWIVADNLRKGAATNAVQILEVLIKKGFVIK